MDKSPPAENLKCKENPSLTCEECEEKGFTQEEKTAHLKSIHNIKTMILEANMDISKRASKDGQKMVEIITLDETVEIITLDESVVNSNTKKNQDKKTNESECEVKSDDNKHTKSVEVDKKEVNDDKSKQKYDVHKCEACPFKSSYISEIWIHGYQQHSDGFPAFNLLKPKVNQLLLSLMMGQNLHIISNLASLKQTTEELIKREEKKNTKFTSHLENITKFVEDLCAKVDKLMNKHENVQPPKNEPEKNKEQKQNIPTTNVDPPLFSFPEQSYSYQSQAHPQPSVIIQSTTHYQVQAHPPPPVNVQSTQNHQFQYYPHESVHVPPTQKKKQKREDDESPLVEKRETVIVHTSNVPQIEPEKEKEKLSDKKDRKRKREDEELAKIHFSREYPCIEIICKERFEHKTQLEKHMRTNHKCEHCNITCDNVTNLTIHIEKDTFVHCLEFYLKKRYKREDERKDIV